MAKKVEDVAVQVAANEGAERSNSRGRNLYVRVITYNCADGKIIGDIIRDMYHIGTTQFFQGHLWWGTHNYHRVEVLPATPDEINNYIEEGKRKLAEKFNQAA